MNERVRHWILWGARVVLGVLFLLSGGAKLVGVEQTVEVFREVGLGQWFRYLTGLLEVIGAALLVVPDRAAAGAAVLGTVMAGAFAAHLFVIGGSPLPPAVLLLLLVVVGVQSTREPDARRGAPSAGSDRPS